MSAEPIPVAILGGGGYVAGELARLLLGHPRLQLVSHGSTRQVGEPVARAFPHLAALLPGGFAFEDEAALIARFVPGTAFGVFAATPHGETAALVDRLLSAGERVGADLHVVDLSADFRFPDDPARFEAIYGPHGAPLRLGQFVCGVPEHVARRCTHASQPGCFTTAVAIAAYPFFAQDLVEDDLFVAAVTGSSGSGKTPGPGTHHPDRHGAFHAYAPLAHRHEAEMRRLLGAARGGREPEVEFVPHSGPFVRGIHATLRLTLRTPTSATELMQGFNAFYASKSPFVTASVEPPKLAEVVGTNRCRIGLATRGRALVVTSVIDNLVKGAAGGAVQWMNRLFDLPEDAGLRLSGLGWT